MGASSSRATSTNQTANLLTDRHPFLASAAGGPTTCGQRLITYSGTSVAGAAAVLLQANPGLTLPLIKAILQHTAQSLNGPALVGNKAQVS